MGGWVSIYCIRGMFVIVIIAIVVVVVIIVVVVVVPHLATGLIINPLRVIARETGPGPPWAGGAVHCSNVDDMTIAVTDIMLLVLVDAAAAAAAAACADDEDIVESLVVFIAKGTVGPNTQANVASLRGNPEPRIDTMVPPNKDPEVGWVANSTTGERMSNVWRKRERR